MGGGEIFNARRCQGFEQWRIRHPVGFVRGGLDDLHLALYTPQTLRMMSVLIELLIVTVSYRLEGSKEYNVHHNICYHNMSSSDFKKV